MADKIRTQRITAPDGTEWFENPDFWTDYAPVLFDAGRWAEAPQRGIL